MTISEMLTDDSVAIEVDVVGINYDYFFWRDHEWPIQLSDLSVISVLSGSLDAGAAPRLLLPGGPERDGGWFSVAGTPKITTGDRLILVGRVDDVGVMRLSAFAQSLFRRASDGTLTNHAGGPLVDIGCDRMPELPSTISRESDLASPILESALPMRWSDFLSVLSTCVPAEVAQ